MLGKNQHVTEHSSGGWQVKDAGNSQATARTSTQQQAIHIALHQHSELIIRGTDDRIRAKDSFGNDPLPPRN